MWSIEDEDPRMHSECVDSLGTLRLRTVDVPLIQLIQLSRCGERVIEN
jgi:hypothetical protein